MGGEVVVVVGKSCEAEVVDEDVGRWRSSWGRRFVDGLRCLEECALHLLLEPAHAAAHQFSVEHLRPSFLLPPADPHLQKTP